MPFEDTELLDLTNIKNLIKHHLLFYANLECIIEKID